MVLLVESKPDYNNDFRAMIQAFFANEKIVAVLPSEVAEYQKGILQELRFIFTALFDEKHTKLKLEENGRVVFTAYVSGDYRNKNLFRNKIKLAAYRLISEYTGRTLPWGSLTGMRPTKIASKSLEKGLGHMDIVDSYMDIYQTSEEKAELAVTVAEREKQILSSVDPREDYCLYIGIPFCPSRCLYCSFTAYPIAFYKDKVDAYIDALIKELQCIAFINRNKKLKSIYVGGGTPTAISAKSLERLLSEVENYFDFSYLEEYTVEAGRPDSITEEKLQVMKNHKVSRISINPQTMKQDTLRIIGRAHTVDQIHRAYRLARKVGFDHINMDIIAGLPKETPEDMRNTLAQLEKMGPESITVHSLALKRAARLSEEMEKYRGMIGNRTDIMLSLAQEKTHAMGLEPYYLYRQKNISGNLENVGYAKYGKECIYNILIIEERLDIWAAGAGAVTRKMHLDENGKVIATSRIEDVKDVDSYIERIDEMIERKQQGGN